MPRPPVKAEYRLAKARAKGEAEGKAQAERKLKWSEKGWLGSLREHVGKAIDRIDPIEAAATVVGAYLIHDVLFNVDTIIQKIDEIGKKAISIGPTLFGVFGQLAQGQYGEAGVSLLEYIKPKEISHNELWLWALSFFIAVMLIKNGANVLGLLQNGLIPFAGMLIGI